MDVRELKAILRDVPDDAHIKIEVVYTNGDTLISRVESAVLTTDSILNFFYLVSTPVSKFQRKGDD